MGRPADECVEFICLGGGDDQHIQFVTKRPIRIALATDGASVSYTNVQANWLLDIGLHMPQDEDGEYRRKPRTPDNKGQVWGRVCRMPGQEGVIVAMCRMAPSPSLKVMIFDESDICGLLSHESMFGNPMGDCHLWMKPAIFMAAALGMIYTGMIYSRSLVTPGLTPLGALMEKIHYSYDRKDLSACFFICAVGQWPTDRRLLTQASTFKTAERKAMPSLVRCMLLLAGLERLTHSD